MLEKEIIKLGLSDKEAKVYLASLELGPATAQIIAQKANVKRATTYVIAESLMEMGLMSTYDQGKKTFFSAESPERLLEYLKDQERKAGEKIELLKEKMSELQSIRSGAGEDKPKVKYFEGVEGLRAVQDDFVDSINEGDMIYTFLPYDNFYGTNLGEKVNMSTRRRKAKKIKMLVIYNSKKGRQLGYEAEAKEALREYKYVPYDKFPFEGGMNIYGSKIFMIDYLGKTGGVVIENKTLANMMAKLFEMAWKSRNI